jgi:type IV secretory pathway TrbD component
MRAERRVFFFALMMGAVVFNLLYTFLGGILMFCLLYFFARWTTKTDPQILRFSLNSARLRTQHNPAKFTPVTIRNVHRV